MTDGLIEFVRARLDGHERLARECPFTEWEASGPSPGETYLVGRSGPRSAAHLAKPVTFHDPTAASLRHAAHHDPAHVLRQVQAHRAILDAYEQREAESLHPRGEVFGYHATGLLLAMRHLASIWSDHPDFQQEWA